jgi:hypothetical protein
MGDGEATPPADPSRPLPTWIWDAKALTLSPRCPTCGNRIIASGNRFTCLIVGFSHYDEPVSAVMGEVYRRLEGQPPEAR